MTPFSIVHHFETDRDTFWKIFFHEPYNEELYQRIGVKERRLLEKAETPEGIHFVVRIMPRRDLPGFLKKLIGGDLGYTEISTWHRATDTIDVRVEPTLVKDKVEIKALYKLEPDGPGRLKRTFAGTISVDVLLVGRKVEEFVIADMTRAYDTAAQVTSEWIRHKKLA